MKPKVLVTHEVFDEVLEYLSQHFEVTSNQSDLPFNPETLAVRLSDKQGALITLSDRIDTALLSRYANLKAVCNIAVGYNNIDLIERESIKKTNIKKTKRAICEERGSLGQILMRQRSSILKEYSWKEPKYL